ncbi:DM13 domain-containing protein [Thalassomonas sp. M1454]|uniref:DM13 domain-containing protein n=1 Tax=Thalassomonas sp. M1454 TaxID=2594477 RepID=UPI001180BD82|nr:DM13 domain-containing protein [Thalassomonas sp. M1454]TRX58099.1 DM13 domain-containing protein [Thalassomonas sp. M1454]
MKIQKLILLSFTHLSMLAFGFIIGIYLLPILIAPPSPTAADIKAIALQAEYRTEFTRDLKGSDLLHWGEGRVSLSQEYITLMGELAPGPEYKLYLSPKFVETEAEFELLKPSMQLVGDVDTFDNFMVKLEASVKLSQFNTVVVWCEAFGEFITSAKYR